MIQKAYRERVSVRWGFSGAPHVGDEITVTVAGDATPTTYTVTGADLDAGDAAAILASIATNLAAAINADTDGTTTAPAGTAGAAGVVTATASGAVVTLTAKVAGTAGAFDLAVSVTNVTANSTLAAAAVERVAAADAIAGANFIWNDGVEDIHSYLVPTLVVDGVVDEIEGETLRPAAR